MRAREPEEVQIVAAARAALQPVLALGDQPGWAELIEDGRWPGGIEAIWPPVWDEQRASVQVGRFGPWVVQLVNTFFNYRLVLSHHDDVTGYTHGWCYPKGPGALLAVLTWFPAHSSEPPGFVKRATPNPPPPLLEGIA